MYAHKNIGIWRVFVFSPSFKVRTLYIADFDFFVGRYIAIITACHNNIRSALFQKALEFFCDFKVYVLFQNSAYSHRAAVGRTVSRVENNTFSARRNSKRLLGFCEICNIYRERQRNYCKAYKIS